MLPPAARGRVGVGVAVGPSLQEIQVMLPTKAGGSNFSVQVPDEAAMHRFMRDIAPVLHPGDLVTLSGDLGAGKTTFARALIRHLAGDDTIEVPSPTFTLIQAYELERFPVVHADLYRLEHPSEMAELGFDDNRPLATSTSPISDVSLSR